MIISFKDERTEDIFNGKSTKAARKTCPRPLWKIATRKLDQLDSVTTLKELRIPPGNGLEALKGGRGGQHSIRSTTSIACASRGPMPARIKPSSWTITEALEARAVICIPTHRPPTHPGEMLLEEFLTPMGLSQRELAEALHVPYQRINEIVNGRRGVTPSTALRLARFLGMSADLWLNLQARWDLYHARIEESEALEAIRPHVAA